MDSAAVQRSKRRNSLRSIGASLAHQEKPPPADTTRKGTAKKKGEPPASSKARAKSEDEASNVEEEANTTVTTTTASSNSNGTMKRLTRSAAAKQQTTETSATTRRGRTRQEEGEGGEDNTNKKQAVQEEEEEEQEEEETSKTSKKKKKEKKVSGKAKPPVLIDLVAEQEEAELHRRGRLSLSRRIEAKTRTPAKATRTSAAPTNIAEERPAHRPPSPSPPPSLPPPEANKEKKKGTKRARDEAEEQEEGQQSEEEDDEAAVSETTTLTPTPTRQKAPEPKRYTRKRRRKVTEVKSNHDDEEEVKVEQQQQQQQEKRLVMRMTMPRALGYEDYEDEAALMSGPEEADPVLLEQLQRAASGQATTPSASPSRTSSKMSSHRRKRKKREVSSLLDGNYWQVSAASSSDGKGQEQEEEEEEAEEGDDAIEKRLASGPTTTTTTTQQVRKVVQAALMLALGKSEAMEVVGEEAEGDETERTKDDRSANVKRNAKEAREEGGEEQKGGAAATKSSDAGGALHEQKEEDDGKALAEVDRGDNKDRRTTMEVAEETERRTEPQPGEIKPEIEGVDNELETTPLVGGGVAIAATAEEAAEGTVIKRDDTSVREEEAEERQQQQKDEEEVSEEERSRKGTTTTTKKKEEGIWQRVKRRRKERPKAGGASGLFELGPALPVSFSSVSIYSAHSPIPLPSIGTALQRRLKGSKAGGADDGDELLDGTVNTGRKAQFACWRRPNRSIPSPISQKVRRRLAMSGGQDPFTQDDSDRLGLWYVLATEDDPQERYHPIDNYSIHRRYEIALSQWERLGRRWHGHVDTHGDFLRRAHLRERQRAMAAAASAAVDHTHDQPQQPPAGDAAMLMAIVEEPVLQDLGVKDCSSGATTIRAEEEEAEAFEAEEEEEDVAEEESDDDDFGGELEEGDEEEADGDAEAEAEAEAEDEEEDASEDRRAAKGTRSSHKATPTTTSLPSAATMSERVGRPAKVKRSRYPVPTKLPKTAENCHHCKVKKEYWLHCPIVDKHRYCHRCAYKHFRLWYDDAFPTGGVAWAKGCPLCLHTCPCASCRKKHLADGATSTVGMDEAEGDRDLGAARPVPAHKAAKKVARSDETNSEDDEIDILGVSDDGEDRPPAQQPAPEGDLWEVKRVLACRMHAKVGAKEYLVRWKDTWLDRESLEDDEFKDAIRAIVATSPRGRTKWQRHAKAATKKTTRREDDVAGSDAQCLVRWKDTWEPAANLSLSCLARWDAEQQERERRTATTTTTTATPRKRGRPKGVKNKAAAPLRPRAKKNEERRTRVGKRKREDDEESEEESEKNENEEEEREEEEEKNEEREEEHEDEEEEEEEETRVRAAREGLGASPLLAHNFERLRKRKRSRLKDSLNLPTRQPDLPPPLPRGRDEEAEADEEQQQLDGVFDHPAGFAPVWFPHTVPYDESIGMSEGSPDILSMQAMPAHTIDLQDLPHAVLDESLLNIFEIGIGDEAEESVASHHNTSTRSGGGGAGVDDVSSFLSLSPFEEAATSHHHHHHTDAAAVTAASPYVSPRGGAGARSIQVWAHFAGQEPELMTDIDPMRLVGHLKNLLRERLGLKGLISLRLLAKGQSVEDAEVEAEAERGQPLDPKKTLREQGVFDGCDILVTQPK